MPEQRHLVTFYFRSLGQEAPNPPYTVEMNDAMFVKLKGNWKSLTDSETKAQGLQAYPIDIDDANGRVDLLIRLELVAYITVKKVVREDPTS